MYKPRQSINYVGRFYTVLEALIDYGRPVSLTQFREMVSIHLPQEDKPVGALVDTLLQHNILERSPESDDEWYVAHPIKQAITYLSGRYEATLPGAFAGILRDIKDEVRRLTKHIEVASFPDIELARESLVREINKALYASYEHSAGIQSAVSDLKRQDKQRTLAERCAEIVRLHDLHLEPIEAMVDSGGLMQESIEGLLDLIRYAYDKHGLDSLLYLKAHVMRFKRESFDHFEAARTALLPLYTQVRRDHAVSVAASEMLDAYEHNGARAWDIGRRLGIVRTRVEGVTTDLALMRFLSGVAEHSGRESAEGPRKLVSSRTANLEPIAPPLFAEDVIDAIQGETDSLAYLFEAYPDQDDDQILGVYSDLMLGRAANDCRFSNSQVQRVFRSYRYTYYPMQVVLNVSAI